MKARPNHGLFARILTGYIALALAVAITAGCAGFCWVRKYTLTASLAEMQRKAAAIAEIAERPEGRARVLNSSRLYDLQRLVGARIIYVDADMTARFLLSSEKDASEEKFLTRADYAIARAEITDAADRALIGGIFEGKTICEARRVSLLDARVEITGAPIHDMTGGDPFSAVGAILLYKPADGTASDIKAVAFLFALAGFLAICTAFAIAWALARRVEQPVTRLNRAAKAVFSGEYGEISAIKGPSEIEELADTFNGISGALRATIESLSDEKSKLQQILLGIGEGIVAIDVKGEIIHHNAAALQLLETTAWRLDGELEAQGNLRKLLEKAISEKDRFETDWENPVGKKLRASVYPVYDDSGAKASGAVALLRDVSEAARLEQMRRDYIANVSHELRTPLTGIRGMIEPLMDGYMETEAEKADSYRVIYQETIRLEKLIGDMLDMSRLQEGRVAIELNVIDARAMLLAALARGKQRAADTGIRLSLSCEEKPLLCMGDEDRVLQVLLIFLDNAFGFTPSGGEITLFGRAETEGVTIGVRDTGSGIDPKDLPYIWERFFKADRSRMRTTGTGLGLSIAKMVAELLQAEIGARSEPGRGSEFFLRLPSAGERPEIDR